MAKRINQQKYLAQNFLRCPKLANRLVERSTICADDTVYEIGPGRGIITAALSRVAKSVIAIEKDPALARSLRKRFQACHNVRIITADFLRYTISQPQFKVFSNIPYNLSAGIIRRLLFGAPKPKESFLVVQKEAALKYTGKPMETQFSIIAKPFYRLRVVRQLRRTDFYPVPKVDSVSLHIEQRRCPLIDTKDANGFRRFVCQGFAGHKKNLRLNLKGHFTYRQWKRLALDLGFHLNAKPSELHVHQWIKLFNFFHQLHTTRLRSGE